ncbi:type II toxin-antitoxin system YhaV family toxin [Geminocystis herdmanii]|uniref:type II toxin-antitoxin system YhaV family toxin n=1 Tax=Geminocystis herdmanii TaxID=669359 RepID=UPI000348EBFD|nr:type II toxin-antitoxin system YhaV family toxin [Geminocystis herdmanii]
MKPIKINGYLIYFHPLFYQQWLELVNRVKYLRKKLETEHFIIHPEVKLLKALDSGIKDKIPTNPLASYFLLKKPLQKYSRLKKMGLQSRYRLFFRVFKKANTIIILWLGFPRKEGDKKDCYEIFSKMVINGNFPEDVSSFLDLINQFDK